MKRIGMFAVLFTFLALPFLNAVIWEESNSLVKIYLATNGVETAEKKQQQMYRSLEEVVF